MNHPLNISLRRRAICCAGIFVFLTSACEAKPKRIFLNISLFSYLDRPVFDVKMNGTDFMSSLEHEFYGANDVMTMQSITLGRQIVTWTLSGPEGAPGNGVVVTAKNSPVLSDVPKDVKWLALHIYPDDTVEIKLSKGTPDELQTERGKKIIDAWESRNGR